MIKKLSIIISVMFCLCASVVQANNIYINQVGDNADIEITQDGDNNRVSRKEDTVTSTPNKATFCLLASSFSKSFVFSIAEAIFDSFL